MLRTCLQHILLLLGIKKKNEPWRLAPVYPITQINKFSFNFKLKAKYDPVDNFHFVFGTKQNSVWFQVKENFAENKSSLSVYWEKKVWVTGHQNCTLEVSGSKFHARLCILYIFMYIFSVCFFSIFVCIFSQYVFSVYSIFIFCIFFNVYFLSVYSANGVLYIVKQESKLFR